MSEGKQSRLSPAQKADVWSRWKAGESLHEIGRAYGKPHNCIRCVLLSRGGIAPAARQRSGIALSLAEREDISRGIASGSSIRTIASGLGRAASTVSREVTRQNTFQLTSACVGLSPMAPTQLICTEVLARLAPDVSRISFGRNLQKTGRVHFRSRKLSR